MTKTRDLMDVQTTVADPMTPNNIDPRGFGLVMQMLSGVYHNDAAATLREYAINALDSHTVAGQTRPVEVTLPTSLEPTLTIQDWGVGLSREEVLTVYSCYTLSTKRDDDAQTGEMGIGSKAAYALKTQFTVTAVRDGWRTVALFALNGDGIPSHQLLDHAATDEPNGVTVRIGILNVDGYADAALQVFGVWRPGTVLVDGKEPVSALSGAFEVAPGIHAKASGSGSGSMTIVMASIGYPANEAIRALAYRSGSQKARAVLDLVNKGLSLWAEVPNGLVDITPSRENLRDTKQSVRALQVVAETYADSLPGALAALLDAEPTPMHVSLRLRDLRGLVPSLSRDGVMWRDQRLPYEVKIAAPALTLYRKQADKPGRVMVASTWETHLGWPAKGLLVVTGSDAGVRRLANRFLTNTPEVTTLLLLEQAAGSVEWFSWGEGSPTPTMTAEEFKVAAKKFAPTTPRTVRDTTYFVSVPDRPMARVFMTGAEVAEHEGRIVVTRRNGMDSLLEAGRRPDDLVVFLVGGQTVNGLRRRVGDVVFADQVRRDHAAVLASAASDAMLSLVAGKSTRSDTLALLIPVRDQITDPALRAAVCAEAEMEMLSTHSAQVAMLSTALSRNLLPAEVTARIEALPSGTQANRRLMSKVPLLFTVARALRYGSDQTKRDTAKELLLYVNAALA